MTAVALSVEGVGKAFGAATPVLADVSFHVPAGGFAALIGPSGCGKTTLLRIVHGLEAASAGVVRVGGSVVAGPAPGRAIVFQHFNLFPWRTVAENVRFGLEVLGADAAETARRVDAAIALVRLEAARGRYPHQLSGGMQQRVGLARALALEPSLLLLDEPFGALDAITREKLQREIADILQRLPRTCLLVTHSMDEALFFADTVLVMGGRPGRIVAEVAIPFPHPRDPDAVRKHPDFAGLRERLWGLLAEGADV